MRLKLMTKIVMLGSNIWLNSFSSFTYDRAVLFTNDAALSRVTFTPTVEHCSMATVIGLCLRVKLMRSLPSRYKVLIYLQLFH